MGRIGTGFLVAVALSLAFLSQPAAAQSAAERCEKLSGGLDAAIAACDEALRLDPKNAAAYYIRGRTWYFKRDYDLAIADYDRAIELDPKYARAYYNRGHAWLMKGDPDRSIADYNRAIELDPIGTKTSSVYYWRGFAWSKKDTDRALADYNRAIELDPKNALAYNDRGAAWRMKGDYDRAIADYNRAIELDPKYDRAYYNRGLVHEDREGGDLASALADFRTFVSLNRFDPDGPRAVSRIEAKIDARNKR